MRTLTILPTLVPLPDEILLCVFEQLDDPLNLARVERVARQWFRVARDHQHLWRSAIGIDMGYFVWGNGKIGPARIRHRIDQLCARSGGKLDRLALMLPWLSPCNGESICNVEDVEYIVQLLPTLHLEELWFEGVKWDDDRLSDSAPTCERSAGYNEALNKRIPGLLVASLHRCEHLTKLYIDAYGSVSVLRLTRSLAGTLLSTCRLKEFYLSLPFMKTLLDDASLCDMLQSATHISLQPDSHDFGIKISQFWRLLQRAGSTLEQLDISSSWVLGPPSTPLSLDQRPRIYLPRLTKLKLSAVIEEVGEDQALPFQLECPALTHVHLLTDYPLLFVEALLGSHEAPIEALVLMELGHRDSNVDSPAIARLLSDRCGSTLQRLMVDEGADAQLQELARYPTMKLDTISVAGGDVSLDALVDLVQSRLLSDASYRPIRDLAFPFCGPGNHDERTKLRWLRNNVALVEEYDPRQHDYHRRMRFREVYDTGSLMQRRPGFFLTRRLS